MVYKNIKRPQPLLPFFSLFYFLILHALSTVAQPCEEIWANFDHHYINSTGNNISAEGFVLTIDGAGHAYAAFTVGTGEVGVVKIDENTGETVWNQTFCPPSANCGAYKPNAIEVDGDGNVFVAGYEHNFASTAFGLGIWLRKYSSSGVFQWETYRSINLGQVQRFFTTNTTKPVIFMKLDATGNVFIAGRDYDIVNGPPYIRFYLEKFDNNGNSLWSVSSPEVAGVPIAMDIAGNGDILIGGGSNLIFYLTVFDQNGLLKWDYLNTTDWLGLNDATFGPSNTVRAATTGYYPATTIYDMAVLTFDNTGAITSTLNYALSGSQYSINLEIDNAGNNILSGLVTQTVGLPYTNWLILKGDQAGNVIWWDEYDENPDNDEIPSLWDAGLSLDADGNVFVTGYGGPLYFSGSFNVASAVTVQYDGNTGNRTCVQADQTGLGTGISVIPTGNNFLVGGFGRRRIVKYGSTPQTGVNADLKVFLKGPYGTPAFARYMKTDINAFLPLNQPYAAAPWNHAGNEAVGSMPLSVVDWVLVEVRTGVSASSAYERKAAFVHNNGLVTAPSGASLHFQAPPSGNSVYFVIYHRNHLGLMTGTAVSENNSGKYAADLTKYGVFGGIPAGVVVNSGVLAMAPGDADGSNDVNAIDRNSIWQPANGSSGDYFPADLNLDGQVNDLDQNTFWLPFNGRFTLVPQ